jgi:hypothetical protein
VADEKACGAIVFSNETGLDVTLIEGFRTENVRLKRKEGYKDAI